MAIQELITRYENEMIEKWLKLTEKCGSAYEEEKMQEVASYIKELFEDEGFECQLIETGQNCPKAVVGRRNCVEGSKPVIFSGHYDTVFNSKEWSSSKIVEGTKLQGPGALDMKGGIIVALFTAKVLREAHEDIPLKIAFVGDEEIGHTGSFAPQLLKKEAEGGRCAFNMETGFMNNDVCIGRKGTAIAEIIVRGVSSHPGNAFEKGRNAIVEMCNKVEEMEKLTDLKQGMSVSVNTISGGSASNVIPDLCKVQADLRFSTLEQYEGLKAKIDEICRKKYIDGTESKVEFVEAIMPFECTERELTLCKAIKKAARYAGQREPEGQIRGGASDAAYLQAAEIPVLCAMGVRGENSHSKGEYAVIGSLSERTALLSYFLTNMDSLLEEGDKK